MGDAITLAQLATAGRLVVVQCGACPHRTVLKPIDLGVPRNCGGCQHAVINCNPGNSEPAADTKEESYQVTFTPPLPA